MANGGHLMSRQITVYGVDECEDTQQTRQYLDDMRIKYRYVNVENDEEALQWLLEQNDGKQKTPTVDLGGLVLSVPSGGELEAGLRRQGFLSRRIDWPAGDGMNPDDSQAPGSPAS